MQTGKRWTTEEEFLTLFAVRVSSLMISFTKYLNFTERGRRIRRRSEPLNGIKLCPGARDFYTMSKICSEPTPKCSRKYGCFRYVKCDDDTDRGCKNVHHSSVFLSCCAYTCNDNGGSGSEVLDDEATDTSGNGPGGEVDDEEAEPGNPDGRSSGSGSFAYLRRLWSLCFETKVHYMCNF